MSESLREKAIAEAMSERHPLRRAALLADVERRYPLALVESRLAATTEPLIKLEKATTEPLKRVTATTEPYVARTHKERQAAYRARKRAAKDAICAMIDGR